MMAGDAFEVADMDLVVAVGKTLTNAVRVPILFALANDGPASASMLARKGYGKVSDETNAISNATYHLSKLFEAGLTEVVEYREGRGSREKIYGLTALGLGMVKIVSEIGK
jgi:DNA-binding transcriptional ArsR family regulator